MFKTQKRKNVTRAYSCLTGDLLKSLHKVRQSYSNRVETLFRRSLGTEGGMCPLTLEGLGFVTARSPTDLFAFFRTDLIQSESSWKLSSTSDWLMIA